jgi:hypothetical protein
VSMCRSRRAAELLIRGLLNPFQRLKESITDRPA